ncbi:hypothetical protein IG631_15604 [Alternaria alternata]|jgi:hypothetical protein|nr:hypothetical protein IG631_15604 [Alternaria alternata]
MPANLDAPPAIQLNGATEPTTMNPQPSVQNFGEPARPAVPTRNDTTFSKFSTVSVPPEGSILTGKQEHCKQYIIIPGPLAILIDAQISSANSSPSKPSTKSPNSPLLQRCDVLARPFAQMPAKLRQKTQNCPSSATYS